MFIGHFAPAFAARAITGEAPKLGTLFVAAQLTDWAFMALFMIGLEDGEIVPGITVMSPLDLHTMPYTHSLLGTAAFALALGLLVGRWSRNLVAGTWAAIVVLSHWFLDLLVHRPDLTLVGGQEKFGFGLWNYPWIEVPLELGITLTAFVWYVRATKGPPVPPLILIGSMVAFQLINWLALQPTEYSVALPLTAMAAFGILTAIAYWTDSTRWHKSEIGLGIASPPL